MGFGVSKMELDGGNMLIQVLLIRLVLGNNNDVSEITSDEKVDSVQ